MQLIKIRLRNKLGVIKKYRILRKNLKKYKHLKNSWVKIIKRKRKPRDYQTINKINEDTGKKTTIYKFKMHRILITDENIPNIMKKCFNHYKKVMHKKPKMLMQFIKVELANKPAKYYPKEKGRKKIEITSFIGTTAYEREKNSTTHMFLELTEKLYKGFDHELDEEGSGKLFDEYDEEDKTVKTFNVIFSEW